LTLVCATLGAGGAERVLTTLANAWTAAGVHVTLITLSGRDEDFYPVGTGVERVGLGVLGNSAGAVDALVNNWRRVRALRRAIVVSNPQVVISFMDVTNVQVLLATRGMGIPVLVSERIDPRYHPLGKLWGWLRKRVYPRAAGLVVQTNGVAEWARTLVPANKVHVIGNPLGEQTRVTERANGRERTVVGMGRLEAQKGFDLLVRAFAAIVEKAPEWRLVIYGEGDLREQLLQLARELGIADKVALPGRTTEPQKVLSECGMFVLSSRYEGMPNALMEAMAAGTPCVSFDCPSGPADLILNGINGLLVPAHNVEGLAAAVRRLIEDDEERERLGAAALEVRKRFGLERVLENWNGLLAKV